MPAPPPMQVPELTPTVAREVRAVAQALPFRRERGVDAERVFWIETTGGDRLRVGIAWAAPTADEGAFWMIALAAPDRRPVPRARVREVARLILGRDARYELAPPFDGAPHMTLVRAPAG